MECTGVAARWCPRHGTCTCPDNPIVVDREPGFYESPVTGELRLHSGSSHWEPTPGCPLHSKESNHPLP